MKTEVFYCYNGLDKLHEYQIVAEDVGYGGYWQLWLWFYLGKLTGDIEYRLFPFKIDYGENQSILIKAYKGNSADKVAKQIVKEINKHFKKVTWKKK